MCHAWVKWIIRRDRRKIFKFAPLESDKARDLVTPIFPGYLAEDTIILFDEGKIYTRSNAILHIFSVLGFPYSMLTVGKLIPASLRNSLYAWIAQKRYTYGKRYDECPLPPPEWRDRFKW